MITVSLTCRWSVGGNVRTLKFSDLRLDYREVPDGKNAEKIGAMQTFRRLCDPGHGCRISLAAYLSSFMHYSALAQANSSRSRIFRASV